jgi:hypothetical protein
MDALVSFFEQLHILLGHLFPTEFRLFIIIHLLSMLPFCMDVHFDFFKQLSTPLVNLLSIEYG